MSLPRSIRISGIGRETAWIDSFKEHRTGCTENIELTRRTQGPCHQVFIDRSDQQVSVASVGIIGDTPVVSSKVPGKDMPASTGGGTRSCVRRVAVRRSWLPPNQHWFATETVVHRRPRIHFVPSTIQSSKTHEQTTGAAT